MNIDQHKLQAMPQRAAFSPRMRRPKFHAWLGFIDTDFSARRREPKFRCATPYANLGPRGERALRATCELGSPPSRGKRFAGDLQIWIPAFAGKALCGCKLCLNEPIFPREGGDPSFVARRQMRTWVPAFAGKGLCGQFANLDPCLRGERALRLQAMPQRADFSPRGPKSRCATSNANLDPRRSLPSNAFVGGGERALRAIALANSGINQTAGATC